MSWLRGEGAGGSYRRKDYSQRVRFPVEILDRSGEAHHYGFISAVHIYQTRARSVSHRCTDRRDAQAEWLHCRRRIEQLRHSYLESLPPQLLAILQREAEALGGRRAELGHLLLPLLRELPLVELTPLSTGRPGERSFRLQLGEDRLLLRGYDLEPYGDGGSTGACRAAAGPLYGPRDGRGAAGPAAGG